MRLLLVFLNEPVPGQVKTRLAADVGDNTAAQYYQAMVQVLLRQLHGLENCRIRFCFTPDDADEAVRFWILSDMNATLGKDDGLFVSGHSLRDGQAAQEIDFRAQGEGDPGERLSRCVDQGFADGFREVAVIGSDCPDCGARWINAGFARLAADKTRDLVIGPNNKGGCYYLALKSPASGLFAAIPRDGTDVFNAISHAAGELGLVIDTLPQLAGIDCLDDWKRALTSPLGPALKKALGEPCEDSMEDLFNAPDSQR